MVTVVVLEVFIDFKGWILRAEINVWTSNTIGKWGRSKWSYCSLFLKCSCIDLQNIWMAECKTAVSPVLMRYCSLALSYRCANFTWHGTVCWVRYWIWWYNLSSLSYILEMYHFPLPLLFFCCCTNTAVDLTIFIHTEKTFVVTIIPFLYQLGNWCGCHSIFFTAEWL